MGVNYKQRYDENKTNDGNNNFLFQTNSSFFVSLVVYSKEKNCCFQKKDKPYQLSVKKRKDKKVRKIKIIYILLKKSRNISNRIR